MHVSRGGLLQTECENRREQIIGDGHEQQAVEADDQGERFSLRPPRITPPMFEPKSTSGWRLSRNAVAKITPGEEDGHEDHRARGDHPRRARQGEERGSSARER